MNILRIFLLLCFVISLFLQSSESVLTLGLAAISTVLSIFNTGLGIVNFIDERESDQGVTQEDLQELKDDILEEVTKMLEISEIDITQSVALQYEVSELKDIMHVMKSSVNELEAYIKAENSSDQLTYQNLFIDRFEEHDVILEIRKLANLLTQVVPELSTSLKSLILKNTNCNMTSIIEFEQFYGDLISQAVSLEFAYMEMKYKILGSSLDYWNRELRDIQTTFDDMESVCEEMLPTSVTQEVKENVPLEILHKNSAERYNWKWNDVFEYQPTNAYFVTLSDDDFLFWNGPTENPVRIIVLGDKNTSISKWDKDEVQSKLETNTSNFQEATGDQHAAKMLGKKIEAFVNDLFFVYKGIIVFYEDTGNEASIIMDPLSNAAYVYVPVSENSGYHVYVYPEVWNNFRSYSKQYSEKGHIDSGSTKFNDNIYIIITIALLVAFGFGGNC